MKYIFYSISMVLLSCAISAQVQLDQPLEFTSTGANSRITALETVADDHDAVNRIYVDTAIVNRSPWIRSGSNIHYSAGKVGVGTAAPQSPLDVRGTLFLSGKWDNPGNDAIKLLSWKPSIILSDTGSYATNIKNTILLHHSYGAFRIFNAPQTLDLTSSFSWSERFTIMNNGNTGIGVGSNSATHILHIAGVGRSTSSSWATSSDRRVKEHIRPLETALPTILALRPVEFAWKAEYMAHNPVHRPVQIGFIAQEVEEVAPSMVDIVRETIGDQIIEDFRVLNLSDLTPLLVKALQEQQEQIEILKARIDILESTGRVTEEVGEK